MLKEVPRLVIAYGASPPSRLAVPRPERALTTAYAVLEPSLTELISRPCCPTPKPRQPPPKRGSL